MRGEFVGIVQRATGRRVRAFHSQIDPQSNTAAEVFFLAAESSDEVDAAEGMQVSRISRRALSKLLDSVRAGSEADSQPDRAARPARREPGSYGLCAAKIRSRPGIRPVGARC